MRPPFAHHVEVTHVGPTCPSHLKPPISSLFIYFKKKLYIKTHDIQNIDYYSE